ncbi:MAG: cellulose binding domain-containing protein, partial [Clostridium sp.]|nr:cellulose binding domain-containing protein [Clostridium sp.]
MEHLQKKLRSYVALLLVAMLLVNCSVSRIDVVSAQTAGEDSQHTVTELEKVRVAYSLVAQWTGGYQARISITNKTTETLHNWYLISDINPLLSDIWDAELFVPMEKGCIIKNAGYNQDIPAGKTVSFGYCAKEDFTEYPTTYELRSSMREEDSKDYCFTYRIDKEWNEGFTGTFTITNQSEMILEDWLLTFDYSGKLTSVWDAVMESKDSNHYVIRNAGYNANIAPGQSISFGFSGTKGTGEDIPIHYQIFSYGGAFETGGKVDLPLDGVDVDYTDDDDDGLPNFFEEIIHSDKNNVDSDGDGLPDGYEIFTTLTNPTKIDTDGNGVLDGEEDDDQDGLSNLREYELVIDPEDPDTDGDGLSDLSELTYSMNPNDKDSLDDGILDGERVFTIKRTGEPSDNQAMQPHLALELKGNQVDSFCIEKLLENDPFFNEDIPGYMGNGYEFTVDGSFEEALLSFAFSEEIRKNSAIEPCIYYWNEETQLLEEVEGQFWEEDKLCARLSHFSRYIVLAKNLYEEGAFSFLIEAPKDAEQIKESFDVTFVLDESGSIDSSDFSLMKKQCVELIEQLGDKDRVSLFTYDERVRRITEFTNLETVKKDMEELFQHNGCTASYDAIYEAAEAFSIDSSDNMARNIMILVTDGEDNWSKRTLTEAIDKALEQDIIIYTIGVGYYLEEAKLRFIAKQTGGAY